MKMDLGLESLHNEESTISFEELMADVIDLQNSLMDEQELINGFENCSCLLEAVHKYGVTDTVKQLIGDQFVYTSQEELVAGLESVMNKMIDTALSTVSKFNPETGDFEKNPKDVIMKLRKFAMDIRKALGKIHHNTPITKVTVFNQLNTALVNLSRSTSLNNINALSSDKLLKEFRPEEDNGNILAGTWQRLLYETDKHLAHYQEYLNSEKFRKAVDEYKSGKHWTSSSYEDKHVDILFRAKKQIKVVANTLRFVYAGMRKARKDPNSQMMQK